MKGKLDVFLSKEDLAKGAAEWIISMIAISISQHGNAAVALSGGTTPRSVYALMARDEFRNRLQWERVHLFWGDERCVPPYSSESNYRMIRDSLLTHLAIPKENIHRIPAELEPAAAARQYEQEIKQLFSLKDGEWPEFDLVLLGLGEDGHTASLFPGTPALEEKSRVVTEVFVEKLQAHRVTMTLPVINNASNVLFLVSGKDKAPILSEILEGDKGISPADRVNPKSGNLYWLADRDAAANLRPARVP
jgi:6-phosphogluconolactonase